MNIAEQTELTEITRDRNHLIGIAKQQLRLLILLPIVFFAFGFAFGRVL